MLFRSGRQLCERRHSGGGSLQPALVVSRWTPKRQWTAVTDGGGTTSGRAERGGGAGWGDRDGCTKTGSERGQCLQPEEMPQIEEVGFRPATGAAIEILFVSYHRQEMVQGHHGRRLEASNAIKKGNATRRSSDPSIG